MSSSVNLGESRKCNRLERRFARTSNLSVALSGKRGHLGMVEALAVGPE
jgi:hypothetical protein